MAESEREKDGQKNDVQTKDGQEKAEQAPARTRRKFLPEADGKIHMTYGEYDRLCDELCDPRFQRDGWWPTKAEVRDYIIPNFDICFEFAVWLTEAGKKPVTEEDREVRKELINLIFDSVAFEPDPEPLDDEECEDANEKDSESDGTPEKEEEK